MTETEQDEDAERADRALKRAFEIAQSKNCFVPLEVICLLGMTFGNGKKGFTNEAVEELILTAYLLGQCGGDPDKLEESVPATSQN